MRRTLTYIAAILCIAITTVGCRHREVIPDDTLVDIFHDAFLTNAYISDQKIDTDSLDVYRAIFKKYGYSEKDFMYTIGNFSRRKSAQLGNILGRVTERLSEESDVYKRQVVILDTIRNYAYRKSERVLLKDSVIRIKSLSDTARLYRKVSVPGKGTVTIRYEYEFGEDPLIDPQRVNIYTLTRRGMRNNAYTSRLRKDDSIERKINVDTAICGVRVDFAFPEDRMAKRKKNSLTIRNLDIRFSRSEEAAVDSLFHAMADVMLLATDDRNEKDSL